MSATTVAQFPRSPRLHQKRALITGGARGIGGRGGRSLRGDNGVGTLVGGARRVVGRVGVSLLPVAGAGAGVAWTSGAGARGGGDGALV